MTGPRMRMQARSPLPADWGTPTRAMILPSLCGSRAVTVRFTETDPTGAETGCVYWRTVAVSECDPGRTEPTGSAGLAAADTVLADLGIARTGPWAPDPRDSSPAATVTRIPSLHPPQNRARDRVRAAFFRLFQRS